MEIIKEDCQVPVRSIVTYAQPSDIEAGSASLSLALDWAGEFKARVMLLTFPVDVLGAEAQASGEEAGLAALRPVVAALADRAGVPITVIDRSSFAYGIGDVFADHLKVADLGILSGQPGPLVGERLLAHAALFDSGRPLVILPRKGAVRLPRRTLIAWDGTHVAAHAMQQAIAVLPAGSEAIVARVTDDKELRMGQSGIEAAHHLVRHGFKAEFQDIPRKGRAIHEALFDAATTAGADLIVAGAVRHSPLHEIIFGSVTGTVLDGDCPLPVLLSA